MVNIQEINELNEMNESLNNLYGKLADLEIQGQINSEEYKNTIEHIKLTIEYKLKKISNNSFNEEEIFEMSNYIDSVNQIFEGFDIWFYLCELNPAKEFLKTRTDLYMYRIYDFFSKVKQEDGLDTSILIIDILSTMDKFVDLLSKTYYKEETFEQVKLQLIENIFMDYLLEYIKKEENQEIKAELIRFKYRFIYLSLYLESAFIRNQKDFTKNKYIYARFINFLEKYPEMFNKEYDLLHSDFIVNGLSLIASQNSKYYKKAVSQAKSILISIYIKTILTINHRIELTRAYEDFKEKVMNEAASAKSKENIEYIYDIPQERLLLTYMDNKENK